MIKRKAKNKKQKQKQQKKNPQKVQEYLQCEMQ